MKIALSLMAGVGIALGLGLPTRPPAPQPTPTPSPRATPTPKVATILTREPGGHFLATAAVNDAPVRFVVDTGASVVALTVDDARRANVEVDPAAFTAVGWGASGPVLGQQVVLHDVVLGGRRAHEVAAVVLADVPVSLLGQSYLRTLDSVEIRGDAMTLR